MAIASKPPKVLLVDDEPVLVRVMAEFLKRIDCQVMTASSSAQALQMFQTHADQIHLVIADLLMPGQSGDDLVLKMRAERPEIPIIVCSGIDEEAGRQRAWKLGATAYLAKPVTRDELVATVRAVLDQARDKIK